VHCMHRQGYKRSEAMRYLTAEWCLNVNGIDLSNFTIWSLYMVMTGIMPPKRHPRDRVIVLLDSKCRRKPVEAVKQEVALEVDELESISSKNEGEDIPVKGEGMSLQLIRGYQLMIRPYSTSHIGRGPFRTS
jgi:hypothetical protein